MTFKILKKIHLFFLKRYKNITLTNIYELKKLEQDIPSLRKTVISNGISQKKFNEIQKNINKLNVSAKNKIITYIGNVGIAQNLWTFIELIKNLKMIEFHIIGDGNDFQSISTKIIENNIQNVKLIGRVLEREVVKYYIKSDFLYAKLDPKYSTAIPSKLYEYLSTGKPIIYSGNGASIEFLKNFENIFIINDAQNDIYSFLNSNFDSNFIKKSHKNIKIIKQNYIREKINSNLVNLLQKI